ncbi:class I SAM-dependent methyltransferase [Streptomyces abyssomicinicus]|uniref:class I SAM-dependent methyltransferase n=1 Tax=Streptomyces abyssomicinicus TaxID=574929 RepID=UPI0012504343|nr:class I SAM-dependent methyltransferase [Streptomyces abyssomicinicus]
MTDASAIAAYWNAAASAFDEEPDHGLREAGTRAAWDRLLRRWAPPPPADVLDLGCGTGSLAALLAGAGHRVTGVDLAPAMVEAARAKLDAAGLPGRFLLGDAAAPPVGRERFDMVVVRHLMWTLPDPRAALRDWAGRIRPGGTLLLVEGRWRQSADAAPYVDGAAALPWTGGVLPDALRAAVAPLASEITLEDLTGDLGLWGREVDDVRYALVARMR